MQVKVRNGTILKIFSCTFVECNTPIHSSFSFIIYKPCQFHFLVLGADKVQIVPGNWDNNTSLRYNRLNFLFSYRYDIILGTINEFHLVVNTKINSLVYIMVCKQNCYTKDQNLIMTSKTTLIRCWYELRIR